MIPYLLAVVGGYLIGDSIGEDIEKKIPEFADGGTIELYYVQDANGNVKNISKSYEDADRFWEKSLKFNGDIRVAIVPKEDWEKEKVSSSNIKRYAEGGVMAEGGYVKNYNVFGKVKVLVHDYADETEYETTDFSIDVMALNEQEAMVMVEEQLMDEYLLNDYGTSMLGFKTYYTGEVDIDDVVEIKK